MAATEEMMKSRSTSSPTPSLWYRKINEITTEGGLNVQKNLAIVRAAVIACVTRES
jgi:pyridoxine 5'-phosphate synthase PdxJ